MTKEQMLAIFLLAGLDVVSCEKLANGYCGDSCCGDKPWWLVETKHGWIKIGWRKRVIAIEWTRTPMKFVVTPDDVTKSETDVHAWGWGKAVQYLGDWRYEADLRLTRRTEGLCEVHGSLDNCDRRGRLASCPFSAGRSAQPHD